MCQLKTQRIVMSSTCKIYWWITSVHPLLVYLLSSETFENQFSLLLSTNDDNVSSLTTTTNDDRREL